VKMTELVKLQDEQLYSMGSQKWIIKPQLLMRDDETGGNMLKTSVFMHLGLTHTFSLRASVKCAKPPLQCSSFFEIS
jgi:hypothetical protein